MSVQEQNSVQYFEGPILSGTTLPITEFTFIDNSHVAAKIRGENANWVYGTDYTISGAGTSVRTITILKAVVADSNFAVFLNVPITQGISPEEGGNFPAAIQEMTLDKLTYICQMLYERITRSVQVSIDSNFDGLLYDAASYTGKALIINELGTGLSYSTDKINDIMALVRSILSQVQSLETSAAASASTATTQAGIATTQAGNAAASASTATTQAGIATTQAGNAAASASTATTQAGIATTQAGNAAASASTATTQAGIATTQAGNAAASASTATTQAGIATTQAGNAALSESNSLDYKNAAQTSATNAGTSETNALSYKNAAQTSATNAATSETNADLSADRAEAAASSLETIVPPVGSGGKYPKVKTDYTQGYEFVDLNPQLPIVSLGSISTAITLDTNTITKFDTTAIIDITLPTTLINGVENRVIIDFASTVSNLPNIVTSGILCWSSINNNSKPAAVSTDVTKRNQFILSTIDAGAHWNIEHKTYKERSANTVIYGFYIDTADSNPATRVHYVQDNVAFSNPAYMNFVSDSFNYGDWANAFFLPTPVMLNYNGTVGETLQVSDYTKKVDGTASSIANSSFGGNAMMQWPTIYTKRYTEGNYQYVLKSNTQIDASWKPYSWYDVNNKLQSYCYTGIYQPANISSVLRSLSGQTIFTNAAGTTEITYAKANGAANGWNIGVISDFFEIQELLVLMSRSTDIQGKYGYGRGSAANSVTGECNTKGLFYGTSGNGPLKIFGMENWYGNYWKRTAGCVYTASGWKIKLTEGTVDGSTATSYNSDGTGYILPGLSVSGTSGGFISSATLTQYGFLPTVVSGSSSTYFCDSCWYASGGYALVGGDYACGLSAGAFALDATFALSVAAARIGASLSCKPPL